MGFRSSRPVLGGLSDTDSARVGAHPVAKLEPLKSLIKQEAGHGPTTATEASWPPQHGWAGNVDFSGWGQFHQLLFPPRGK